MKKATTTTNLGCYLTVAAAAVAIAVAIAAWSRRAGEKPGGVGQRGPLDPGVAVRDCGSNRAACFSCEEQAGLAGSSPKCLTCTQPRFRYLTETIQAEMGAQRACRGCRGAP